MIFPVADASRGQIARHSSSEETPCRVGIAMYGVDYLYADVAGIVCI